MKYFIALSLIFTTTLAYAQQQSNMFPFNCFNEWWISNENEIEDENLEDLLIRKCPDGQSPLEVAFETYFSELLFPQGNPEARERLYSYLFGVVMRSSYTMESFQSEYAIHFDLFLHIVKVHIEQTLTTLTVVEALDMDAFVEFAMETLQNGSLEATEGR